MINPISLKGMALPELPATPMMAKAIDDKRRPSKAK